MRGSVIGFDPDTNTGAISGYDGKRYDFTTAEWQGSGMPAPGDVAEFTPLGERATEIRLLGHAYVRPGFAQFYFSPRGRVSRAQYWLRYFLPFFVIAVVLRLAGLIHGESGREGGPILAVLVLFYLAALWPGIAILVKRMHDRAKSGWLVLLLYIPFFIGLAIAGLALHAVATGDIHDGNQLAILGAIVFGGAAIIGVWFFIEFGCMRGTIGPNYYGADPLGPAR
jgi:uncharacterized membrane protein YhaH (DUF805 family)